MSVIGEAFVRVRPEMGNFQNETSSGIKKAFGDVAKIVGGAFAVDKVVDFGKEIVKSAAATQKATQTIRDGFGIAGDSVTKFNESAAAKLGISAEAGQTAAARFATLFETLNIGKGTAADMTLNLEKMAGGLSQIKGTDPSDTLNALYSGVTGATRGLKQLGIVIDSNTIKQKAAELGLVTHVTSTHASVIADQQLAIAKAKVVEALSKYGPNTTQAVTAQIGLEKAQAAVTKAVEGTTSALTPAQKSQAIYAALMDKLAGIQKNAANHTGDLASAQRVLSAEWDNAKEKLGQKLLPIVANVVTAFATNLPGAIKVTEDLVTNVTDRLSGPFQSGLDKARSTIEAVAKALGKVVEFMVQYQNILLPISGAIGGITVAMEAWSVATEVWAAVTEVATAAQEAFNLAVSANLIGVTVLAIAGLVGALVVLYQRSNTVREAINKTWDAIHDASLKVWGGIRVYVLNTLDAMVAAVVTFGRVIRDVFNVFVKAFHGDWSGAWNSFKKIFTDIWSGLSRIASDVLDTIAHYVEKKALVIGLKLIEPFSHIPSWLGGTWAKDLKKNMTAALDALQPPAAAAGASVGDSFGRNLAARSNAWADATGTMLTGKFKAITDAFSATVTKKYTLGAQTGVTGPVTPGLKALEDVLTGMGGSINDDFAASGHATNSFHYKGEAIDLARNAKVAAFLAAHKKMFSELFIPTDLPGGGLYHFGEAFKNSALQQEHMNHIHVTWTGTAEGLKKALDAASKSALDLSTKVPRALVHPDLSGNTAITVGSVAGSSGANIASAKSSLEAAYKKIVDTAKDLGGKLTGTIKKDMANVRTEITDISSKADVTKAKKNLDELRDTVSAALKKLRTEIALNKTFDSLKVEVAKLGTEVTPQVAAQMKKIQAEIGKASTPAQIASVRTQMTKVKAEIVAQLKAINAAIDVEKGQFDAGWTRLASGADRAFQKATQDAIRNMQITVTGAFNSFLFGGGITQTPTQIVLAKLEADHDAAMVAAKLAADQARLAFDQGPEGDPAQIVADQAAIDDDLYTAKVKALQAQAQLEQDAATQQLSDAQSAYQSQRDLLQTQMDDRISIIEDGMKNGNISAATGLGQLTAIFNDPQYGLDINAGGLVIGGQFYAGLSDGLKPVFDLIAKLQKDMQTVGLLPGTLPPPKIPSVVGPGTQTKPGGIVKDSTGGYYDPSRGIYVQGPAQADAAAKAQALILEELKKQTAIAESSNMRVAPIGTAVAR